jgi:hypothetical protein
MFSIGGPHSIVSVAVSGDVAFYRVTQERIVVERCLKALQNIGCFMPDFSYFKIKKLEMGESTMVDTVDRLCRSHQNVVFKFHIFYSYFKLFVLHILNFICLISHHYT